MQQFMELSENSLPPDLRGVFTPNRSEMLKANEQRILEWQKNNSSINSTWGILPESKLEYSEELDV